MSPVSLEDQETVSDRSLARSRSWWARTAVIAGAHIALIAIWQLAITAFKISPFILPAPAAVLGRLAIPEYAWFSNLMVTLEEIVGGFALAAMVGIGMALLFYWSRLLTLLVFPVFVTLNMIPKVALGPLVIMWLRYGVVANILITFSLCLFPILLTTHRGLREIEPDLLDLVRSLKAGRWQLFVKIQLPASLPYIFSGAKVAAILAVAGAVVGEFIASDRGLGYLMIQVQNTFDTAAMMMAILLLTLVGVLVYLVAVALEWLFVPKDARLD